MASHDGYQLLRLGITLQVQAGVELMEQLSCTLVSREGREGTGQGNEAGQGSEAGQGRIGLHGRTGQEMGMGRAGQGKSGQDRAARQDRAG